MYDGCTSQYLAANQRERTDHQERSNNYGLRLLASKEKGLGNMHVVEWSLKRLGGGRGLCLTAEFGTCVMHTTFEVSHF